jgi:hypothetical protein
VRNPFVGGHRYGHAEDTAMARLQGPVARWSVLSLAVTICSSNNGMTRLVAAW